VLARCAVDRPRPNCRSRSPHAPRPRSPPSRTAGGSALDRWHDAENNAPSEVAPTGDPEQASGPATPDHRREPAGGRAARLPRHPGWTSRLPVSGCVRSRSARRGYRQARSEAHCPTSPGVPRPRPSLPASNRSAAPNVPACFRQGTQFCLGLDWRPSPCSGGSKQTLERGPFLLDLARFQTPWSLVLLEWNQFPQWRRRCI
jgi:hypothetical protein